MTNAEKIAEWRHQYPNIILNEDILLEILGVDSLFWTDLSGANLEWANLDEANLQKVNLQNANLRGARLYRASLQNANLQGANLQGADLNGANLKFANLKGANLEDVHLQDAKLAGNRLGGILQLSGVDFDQIIVIPTKQGWQININDWWGDLDNLKELIAQNTWINSTSKQAIKQRPYIENLIRFLESYIALKSSENRKS